MLFAVWGCSAPSPARDVSVRVFVDRNGDGVWDDGDIGIPEVIVTLDGDCTTTCDAVGCAVFESVTGTTHQIVIPPEEVQRLADCGLTVRQPEQTVPKDRFEPVVFLVDTVGFLNVELGSPQAHTVSEPDAAADEDCECTEEG